MKKKRLQLWKQVTYDILQDGELFIDWTCHIIIHPNRFGMKNQILRMTNEAFEMPTSRTGSEILISNEPAIANYIKNYSRFRDELDPRDKEIIHPFSFSIKNISGLSLTGQKFLQSQESKQIHRELFQYLSSMCQNVASISFKLLNEGKLTQNEAKDFASKNILGNVAPFLTQIIGVVKSIVRKEDVEAIAFRFTLEIDDILMEVLKNLASYYPQAPPAGNTAKMREVIVDVNRSWDESTDLIYNRGIKIDKYLRLKSNQSGEILNDYEEYTGFIMEVINSAISVTRQDASEKAEETVFQKFVEFNERLFTTSSHKHYKSVINNILKQKNPTENQDKILGKYFSSALEGNEDDDETWGLQSLEVVRDLFSFFGAKKDTKPQGNQKKKLESSEYLQIIKKDYEDQLQKLKKDSKFALGQKIPTYVKTFTKNDQKETNFFVNSSAVLRVMTKWAQNLEDLFKNSEMIIKQRQYYFKNIKNELIAPNEAIKNRLHQNLGVEYKTVKQEFKKLKDKNTILKSYFITQGQSINTYLKRYTEVRSISSQINASLIQSMRKYLCILIHHILKAGCGIWTGSTRENINLIVFRVNDLLRSKFQCNQTTFINVLNTLYLLDKSSEMKGKFKLVRVKNKLDSKDNNILLNYMFLGKVQCELQLSTQDMKTKEKNYYNFSHFVYELTRGKFGVLTECAIIVSQHDPVVNSFTAGRYYVPKKYPRLQKEKGQEKTSIEFKMACKKDANLFVCTSCKMFVINDNTELFITKIDICNRCIMNVNNPYTLIRNKGIRKYLEQNIANKTLREVTDYSQIQSQNYVITLNGSGKGDLIKLFKVWYHSRQFRLFMIQISSYVLANMSNLNKFSFEDFDYFDVKELIDKKRGVTELAYLCDQENLPAISDILAIDKESLQKIPGLINQFQNYRIEKSIIKAIKVKSQILDLGNDKLKQHMFTNILENTKNRAKKDNARLKKYRNIDFGNVKALNLNGLNLTKAPINFKDLNNLTRLNIEDNNLRIIDLSSIPFLSWLDISNNHLQQLDLTKNIYLRLLDTSCNKLQSINLSKNVNLAELNIQKNNLLGIDLSSNMALTHLNIHKNKIGVIDLKQNYNLSVLNLSNNELKTIDLSQNFHLTELYLNNNKLTTIDLQENIQLVSLNLFCNMITKIDLEKNVNLSNLSMYSNKLTDLDITSNPNLTTLTLYKNQLTEINLTKNQQLTSLNLFGNLLNNVNLTNNPLLTSVNLYNNQLSQIDLTKNLHLTALDLSYNHLKAIDLSRNSKLVSIDLRNNELFADLDVSHNRMLSNLCLNFNKLSKIRFLFNPEIPITAIDLRNQLSDNCDVQIVFAKSDQAKCRQFSQQLSTSPYYRRYYFTIIPIN